MAAEVNMVRVAACRAASGVSLTWSHSLDCTSMADLGEFLKLRVSPHAEEAQHAGSKQREEDSLAAQRA
eukprot:SM000241S08517  [mRNA]  locus=s241:182719:183298:+ [translate_table: standard]